MRSAMIARHSCTVWAAASRTSARIDRLTRTPLANELLDAVGGFAD